MSRLLFVLSPQLGHVFALVPTWLELLQRGHRIDVRCGAQQVGMLAALGITATAVDPTIEARQQDDWSASNPIGALNRSMRTFLDRAPLEAAELERLLSEDPPDAIVVDGLCWGAAAVAERSGLPWAWSASWPLAIESRDTPPAGLGLQPMAGPAGRLRDTAMRVVGDAFMRPHLAALNRLRHGLGVSPVADLTELWTDRAPRTLLYLSAALEYPRSDLPARVALVGAGVWSPEARPPDWLESAERPLILVSCSTERQADAVLARTAIDALAGTGTLIVTTAAASFHPVAPRPGVHVERFVPHAGLLPSVDCVVSTGGMGLIHAALNAGVPVCAVPFGRDQPEVARRVEVAKVGTMLPARRLSADRLRSAVDAARELHEAARAIAPRLGSDTSAARAADLLEALVA